jgi:hypothetical protein
MGNYLIPFEELDRFIKQEYSPEYLWGMFRFIYQNKSYQYINKDPEILLSFKEKAKETNLNKLLSFLNYNLYIRSEKKDRIAEYSDFFEEIQEIEDLEYLKQYHFFTAKGNSEKTSTVLGVYSKEKHDSSYNLLHWIDYHKESNKYRFYRNLNYSEKGPAHIFALKPEISFYFVSKYFEDLLIKSIDPQIGSFFLSNFCIQIKNSKIELDCLVKSGSKFIFIEAKTKLTKYCIEDTIDKFTMINRCISSNIPKNNVKYVLVSAYSDDSCEKSYKYFIDRSKQKSNNKERKGLNTKTYNFDVPMPEFDDTSITCISEPEFEKLKEEMKKICQ